MATQFSLGESRGGEKEGEDESAHESNVGPPMEGSSRDIVSHHCEEAEGQRGTQEATPAVFGLLCFARNDGS